MDAVTADPKDEHVHVYKFFTVATEFSDNVINTIIVYCLVRTVSKHLFAGLTFLKPSHFTQTGTKSTAEVCPQT